MNLKTIMRFSDSLLYALGAMKQSRNSLNLRVTWNGLMGLYEKSDGPTLKSFDQFWRDGFVEFEIPENARKFVRHAKFRQDSINNKLDTESGKIQIFSQKCTDFKRADFKGHPTWFEPA